MSTSPLIAPVPELVPELVFEPESHTYTVGRRTLPSVTQIIRAAGLMDWLDYLPPERLATAQERGTRIHKAIERINLGCFDFAAGMAELEARGETGYIEGFLRWLDESGFSVDRLHCAWRPATLTGTLCRTP